MFPDFAVCPNLTEAVDGALQELSSHNAVAMAAVRDLQAQQSLRLGAPLATKSILLIKAVQKVCKENLFQSIQR